MAFTSPELFYQSAHESMDALYTAVQHSAFAQGYAVRRARTTREKTLGHTDPAAQFNRIEIWCRCGGKSTATVYKSKKTKTGCPFKAIGSLHKGLGDRWLLRVVDGTHNHPPSLDLLEDDEYKAWFAARQGGAWELEEHIRIARMASVPMEAVNGGAAPTTTNAQSLPASNGQAGLAQDSEG
jgi:hypothetical protein